MLKRTYAFVNTRNVGFHLTRSRKPGIFAPLNGMHQADRGTAHLTHYNDGRWVLTDLVIDPLRARVTTSIEVK
jgi:hypothetical protein